MVFRKIGKMIDEAYLERFPEEGLRKAELRLSQIKDDFIAQKRNLRLIKIAYLNQKEVIDVWKRKVRNK